MPHGTFLVQRLALLASLLLFGGCVSTKITLNEVPDQTGGTYEIYGSGFQGNENVAIEMQNAPLRNSVIAVGTTAATNGSFTFKTEDYRCTFVQDATQRSALKNQQVTFVATGVTSHLSASAKTTGAPIFICP